MSRIVLGVSGGIAAYKACELVRRLGAAGHEVTVVPTANALAFVGEATWAALSGRPVATTAACRAAICGSTSGIGLAREKTMDPSAMAAIADSGTVPPDSPR